MTPFLKQVAQIYADYEQQSLPHYCFVFPNKRSATFFRYFLEGMLQKPVVLPDIKTITDLVSDFSPLVEASRYDQLFTLFNQYRRFNRTDIEFDRFLFWADMIVNDFNDVDRYLVDPEKLFVNLRRVKEISSNYLTDEQLSVIRRYWGEEHPSAHSERFWNHLGDKDSHTPLRHKFVRLWEIMLPLYRAFTESLAEKGMATQGMLYRLAAENVSPDSQFTLMHWRYIFVGFNILSTSELYLFKRLKLRDMADFYWDCNPGVFSGPAERAATFIRRYEREFKSRYPLPEEPITTLPHIDIVGVPSNTAQAKYAGITLQQWIDRGIISNTANPIDTAVVLPDEQLFIPALHSIPPAIGNINVTMGFPMRLTPTAALMRSIISLQLRMRHRESADDAAFFHADVTSLLEKPLLHALNPKGADALSRLALKERWFHIPYQAIITHIPQLAPIFTPITSLSDTAAIAAYIDRVCDFLTNSLPQADKMQHRFIESYRRESAALFNAASRDGIPMTATAFFRLIERVINSSSVNFTGEPLSGLQIMGVLETRSLDFRNIIMLSMNERIFPRKHYSRSFIPESLRKAYGMATIEFQETMFAYYFNRLIGRATNVTLLYDARNSGGIRNNEKSRYLTQMLYLRSNHPDAANITHSLGLFPTRRFEPQPIAIKKDKRIMAILNQYREGGPKSLSASLLNAYVNCPLCFYLRFIEGYNPPNELVDYMDSSTYGTILHNVVQQFYEVIAHGFPAVINASMIQPHLNQASTLIDRLVVKNINLHYHHLSDRLVESTPLVGESLIIGKVIEQSVRYILAHDITLTPFTYRDNEMLNQTAIPVNDDLTVNFKHYVDRVDEVDGVLRFIDYKTGVDEITTSSIAELFDKNKTEHAKVILQLMLYCHIYRHDTGFTGPIRPEVYKTQTISVNGVQPITVNKQPLLDYRTIYPEFVKELNALIEEIFNPDIPFTPAPEKCRENACRFCNFKALCGVKDTEQ